MCSKECWEMFLEGSRISVCLTAEVFNAFFCSGLCFQGGLKSQTALEYRGYRSSAQIAGSFSFQVLNDNVSLWSKVWANFLEAHYGRF